MTTFLWITLFLGLHDIILPWVYSNVLEAPLLAYSPLCNHRGIPQDFILGSFTTHIHSHGFPTPKQTVLMIYQTHIHIYSSRCLLYSSKYPRDLKLSISKWNSSSAPSVQRILSTILFLHKWPNYPLSNANQTSFRSQKTSRSLFLNPPYINY